MRNLIAIDAQNLYYSARRFSQGSTIDYRLLKDKIDSEIGPNLSIVYLIRGEGFDSGPFESVLKSIGYRISPKRSNLSLREHEKSIKYDSMGMRIVLDTTVRYVDTYDRIVLISGDVDYSDLFFHLSEIDKVTEYWTFDKVLHPDLVTYSSRVQYLGKDVLQ